MAGVGEWGLVEVNGRRDWCDAVRRGTGRGGLDSAVFAVMGQWEGVHRVHTHNTRATERGVEEERGSQSLERERERETCSTGGLLWGSS